MTVAALRRLLDAELPGVPRLPAPRLYWRHGARPAPVVAQVAAAPPTTGPWAARRDASRYARPDERADHTVHAAGRTLGIPPGCGTPANQASRTRLYASADTDLGQSHAPTRESRSDPPPRPATPPFGG